MNNLVKSAFAGVLIIVLLYISAHFFIFRAAGNIYYISPSGNDTTGNGTSGSPWKTFSKGISVLTPGDTLRAYGGTYNEVVQVGYTKNGTSTDPIIIESVPGQTAIIKGDTSITQVVRIYGSYIHLKNVEIDGTPTSYTAGGQCLLINVHTSATQNQVGVLVDGINVYGCNSHAVQISGRYNGGVRYTSSATVQNSEIHDSNLFTLSDLSMSGGWPSGLKVGRDGENIVLQNNEIYDNYGEGIAVTRGTNVQVLDNIVYNNFSVGIYVDNSINVNVERNFSYCLNIGDPNIILRNGKKATGIATAEEYYSDTPLWGNQLNNIKVINNIVYNCERGFAYWGADNGAGGFRNSIVAHNTFYLNDNTTSAIYYMPEAADSFDFKNNIIKSNVNLAFVDGVVADINADNNYWVGGQPSEALFRGPNDVNSSLVNLNFVTTPTFNVESFRIGSSSLAKDEGYVFTPSISTDFEGNSRDGSPDIGAFEYSASGYLVSGVTGNTTIDLVDRTTGTSIETGGTGVNSSSFAARIRKQSGSNPIADINIDLTANRTWSGLTGDSDVANTKSFIHSLTTQPGASGTYSLYVPKGASHNAVYICPGASSLAATTTSCGSGYQLNTSSAGVSVVNISGQDYWKVDGLSGTGGVSYATTTLTIQPRIVLRDSESANVTSDVEVWFNTATDITASSIIYLNYENNFTGGAAITTSDITVTCDADGIDPVSGTTMTGVSVTNANTGVLTLNTGASTCTNYVVVDINGGSGNQLTNPNTSGNFSWAVLVDVGGDSVIEDKGASLAYVANDNDVNVTAVVPPVIDMELYQTGTDLELADPNTCNLGVLSLSVVRTCSYDIGTGTNNATGVSVQMTSDAGLNSGANDINTTVGIVNAGSEEYGFYISELGGGEYSASGSYGVAHQAVPSSATIIATTNTVGNGTTIGQSTQRMEIEHAASMSTDTVVGSYDQLVTYTAFTN